MTAEEYFFSRCSILPFRKPSQLTQAEVDACKVPFTGWTDNARCLVGLDLSEIRILKIDGASL